MCSSKSRRLNQATNASATISRINGRPVLQPKSNQFVPTFERRSSLKKYPPNSPTPPPPPAAPPLPPTNAAATVKTKPLSSPPLSPMSRSPPIKKWNSSPDPHSASLTVKAPPGSIAAARKVEVAAMQQRRKSRVAHYGRTSSSKSAKCEGKVVVPPVEPLVVKRCTFITPNSDPIYVAYHDEEWGVPVHEDKLLFELLVLTGAQVGSDWTSVLKKREAFREAFSGFDAEAVAKNTEKKMTSISAGYCMDLSQVRGIVDNSHRILEVRREFGSFDKYLWGFVNHKPICTHYKSCQKIPVKTSNSETISKDMVKRGFRFVGPIVMHSFMQAAGLSNDHLITCPSHLLCSSMASPSQYGSSHGFIGS